MRNSLFLMTLCLAAFSAEAQTTITLASNLPPVHTASISPGSLLPLNLADSLVVSAVPAGGTPGYSYAWGPASVFGDPVAMSTKLKFNDTVTVREITLQTTDANGCIALDTAAVDYALPVVPANTLGLEMAVFPNPSSGTVTVTLQGKPTGQDLELVVLDAIGRRVHTERLARFQGSLSRELDLSGLGAGAYFLGFQSGGKQVFKKLMVH